MQGDALAVIAALCRREEALRLGQLFFRVGDHGRIVDEPEPLCARFGGEGCALPEGAVAVLFGLRGLLRQSIGGVAEQKVSTRCGLFQRRTGGGARSFLWSLIPMSAGLVIIFLLRWRINLLTLDEEEAKSLGINIRLYRLILIAASTLLSAASVCLGGLIGWVGLMIPHMARALVGADYGRLIPASAMLGATYLVLMDDLARSLLSMELPLGVVTSIMGAPFFVSLIIQKKE